MDKQVTLPPLAAFKSNTIDKEQQMQNAINGIIETNNLLNFESVIPALEKIRADKKPLSTVIGLQGNETIELDLYKLPFVLIGGKPGAGKSCLLDLMLSGLLVNYAAAQLKLYFVDFEEVTAQKYEDFEHLVGKPITNYDAAYNLFVQLKNIMEDRKAILKSKNKDKWDTTDGAMILIVIDEFTTLLKNKSNYNIAALIQEIIERGRKYGVRAICATQRPSGSNIPTDIRDNFSATIALPVLNRQTSRLITGQPGAGAECLEVGNCLANIGNPSLVRCQIPFVPADKVREIARIIKNQKSC